MADHRWRMNWKVLRSGVIAIALLAVLFVPWRGTMGLPAVLEAAGHVSIHPPEAAQIQQVNAHNGEQVSAGAPLFVLVQPALRLEAEQTRMRINVILARLARRAGSADDLAFEGVLRTQLAESRARLAGLDERQSALRLQSPMAGRIVDRADLRPGQWVGKKTRLADVVDSAHLRVHAYVTEQNLARIERDAPARFVPDDGNHPAVELRVIGVEDVGAEQMPYPILASTYGGPLPMMPKRDGQPPRLDDGMYRVLLAPVDADVRPPQWRVAGQAVVEGPAESFAGRIMRHAASVFVRESGF